MKKTFIFFAVIFANFCLFADEGTFIDKNKFILNDRNGNSFYLRMPFEEVKNILGEPKNTVNIWEKYPEASCAYYKNEYDGITFYCNDISFEILGIYVENENYFIKQNRIGVGSKFSEIKKGYKNIQGKKSERKNPATGETRIIFTKIANEIDLGIKKEDVAYVYAVSFNIDKKNKRCLSFQLNAEP